MIGTVPQQWGSLNVLTYSLITNMYLHNHKESAKSIKEYITQVVFGCRSLSALSYLIPWQPTSRFWLVISSEPCLFVFSTTAGVGTLRLDLWVICSDCSDWATEIQQWIVYLSVHRKTRAPQDILDIERSRNGFFFLFFFTIVKSLPTLSLMSAGMSWASSSIKEWYGGKLLFCFYLEQHWYEGKLLVLTQKVCPLLTDRPNFLLQDGCFLCPLPASSERPPTPCVHVSAVLGCDVL